MLLSQTVGRPVVSAADASRVGTVSGLVVDPESARITGLRLEDTKAGGDVIAWEDVHAVGPDAVVITTVAVARFTAADSAGGHRLLGQRLLTEFGDSAGTLADIAFDPESGLLDTLYTSRGDHIPGHRLLGCGSYAVVVGVG
uniref:PRC-barrel domain-containing protein n=1 Tax=Streptomyces flavofungini TaxID=68200 RepID=UPI0034DE2A1A